MSKPPRILLLLLVFITTLSLTNSLSIKEIKQLPNPLTLAPNERVRLYTEDYFTGFNLTFSSSSSGPKVSQIKDLALSSTSKVVSSKTDLLHDGSLIGLLYEDHSVVIYKYSHGAFTTEITKISLTNAKQCFDLEFMSQETVVVDCDNNNSEKVLYFISIPMQKIIKSAIVKAQYNPHNSRKLTNARHFNDTHLISFISSTDAKDPRAWQINSIHLSSAYDVASINQITLTSSLVHSSFILYDVKAFTSVDLALGGNNFIYWLHNNFNNKLEIKKIPNKWTCLFLQYSL